MAQDSDERPVTIAAFREAMRRMEDRDKAMALDLISTKEEMSQLKETVSTKTDIHRLAGALDMVLDKLETYGRETLTIPATLDSHGSKLEEHERRIRTLESK